MASPSSRIVPTVNWGLSTAAVQFAAANGLESEGMRLAREAARPFAGILASAQAASTHALLNHPGLRDIAAATRAVTARALSAPALREAQRLTTALAPVTLWSQKRLGQVVTTLIRARRAAGRARRVALDRVAALKLRASAAQQRHLKRYVRKVRNLTTPMQVRVWTYRRKRRTPAPGHQCASSPRLVRGPTARDSALHPNRIAGPSLSVA